MHPEAENNCLIHSAEVSEALRKGDTQGALFYLEAMRLAGQQPRLGAVQRWVRDAGDLVNRDPVALSLLDSILRTAGQAPETSALEGRVG